MRLRINFRFNKRLSVISSQVLGARGLALKRGCWFCFTKADALHYP